MEKLESAYGQDGFPEMICIHAYGKCVAFMVVIITVELQLLEHLWDYENLFETGVVRAIEGLL